MTTQLRSGKMTLHRKEFLLWHVCNVLPSGSGSCFIYICAELGSNHSSNCWVSH